MILNLYAIPIEELEMMLSERARVLEKEATKIREKENRSEQDLAEWKITQHALSEEIKIFKQVILEKRAKEWHEAEQIYTSKARSFIRRIHYGCSTDAEWLSLESELNTFFSSLPQEWQEHIDNLFIEDGAGDTLSMICSGIRYQNSN